MALMTDADWQAVSPDFQKEEFAPKRTLLLKGEVI